MGKQTANMRVLLALACIAGVAMCAPLGNTELKDVFETYKTDFKKVYAHASEELLRFKIFADNVNIIRKFNQEQAATEGYTMGINQFTDWSRAEYRELLGYNASAKKPNPVAVLDTANLADSVDWTTKGAVTPVKNQESCGSCWAFSTTGAMEGALAIKNKKLVSFSEQELVDCAGSFGNQGCNGGLMDNGFKYIESKGDALESKYPYTGKGGSCNSAKTTPVAMQPVSVAIEADQSGFQFYKSGVFSGTCGTKLDHGVLAVGYGTDSGKDYWKVKNSWGPTWGQNGYIMLARNTANKAGQCGIAMQPSYPKMSGTPTPPSPPSPPSP